MTKIILLTLIISLAAHIAEAKCKAILVNGGVNGYNNYKIHDDQMREMFKSLIARGCKEEDIYVFSASGSPQAKDFKKDPINPAPKYIDSNYNYTGTGTVKNLYPADLDTLKSKIAEISASLSPDDKMLVYLNDHGNHEGKEKGLVPWELNKPHVLFTEKDLETALSTAPKDTKINIWADCCYCGVFNDISRPNTCTKTATDAYHPGDYFWSNWDDYVAQGSYNGPVTPKVDARFAKNIRNGSSTLDTASKNSQLPTRDDSFSEASTVSNGCMIGPRNNADQYQFNVLGFGGKQLCQKDIIALMDPDNQNISNPNPCGLPENFKALKAMIAALEPLEQYYEETKSPKSNEIKLIIAGMNDMIQKITLTPEYKEIKLLNEEFLKMPKAEQIKRANDFQSQVMDLKEAVQKIYTPYPILLKNQKLILNALFSKQASEPEKAEYKRRLDCSKEALF